MKFGVPVGNIVRHREVGGGVNDCLEVAREAERLGFDSVWVHDHVAVPESVSTRYPYGSGGPGWQDEAYEPLVLMNALAAATSQVAIGVSVLAMPYRHPAVTAKMLAVADLISGGRVVLGVGAGWLREEFEALGLPPGHFDCRWAVTAEYVRAVKEMWTNTGPSDFTGRFVQFHNVGTFPKPARTPHPPIIFGGRGKTAIRYASLLGNGYQSIASSPADLAAQVEALRAVCRSDRRDPDEVEVSLLARVWVADRPRDGSRPPLAGSLEQVMEDLRQYGKAGLDHLVATPFAVGAEGARAEGAIQGMRLMAAEVLPAFGAGR